MSLDALRAQSISIIQTSLSHPLGLTKLPSSSESPFTPKEWRLLELNSELDLLTRQVFEAREAVGLPERRTPRS
jgi:hypothetical protein